MRIVLDYQHINKPNHPKDRGARMSDNVSEVDLVIKYMNQLRMILEDNGHEVFFGLSGSYPERHKFVNDVIRPDLYLAGHLNAGGGRYALVELDHRARRKTIQIAKLIAEEFIIKLPVSKCTSKFLKPDDRGFTCIGGVNCSAIILEPLFLDNDEHSKVLNEYPGNIAIAIARGIQRYVTE